MQETPPLLFWILSISTFKIAAWGQQILGFLIYGHLQILELADLEVKVFASCV